MPLTIGERLGSYEILSPLGAGGMGEVYRARDTKAGRDVAVNILPEELGEHPERLSRFEREAGLLAGLNHPGIATLHGLEDVGGKPLPYDEHTGTVSPDDRRLAYVSNESGQEEVFVTTFPTPGPKLKVSTDGGSEPAWSPDGTELFYRNGEQMLAVPISAGAELDAGAPRVLFEGPFLPSSTSPYTNYDVAPDGRFLMLEGPPVVERIQVVLSWQQELNRLLPTN